MLFLFVELAFFTKSSRPSAFYSKCQKWYGGEELSRKGKQSNKYRHWSRHGIGMWKFLFAAMAASNAFLYYLPL